MGLYCNITGRAHAVELLNRIILDDFKRSHAESIKPLANWERLIHMAQWKSPQDIRNAINSADFLSGNRVIFNIGGNKFRLVVVVIYVSGRVVINWVGTHAEYSKMKF